MNVRRSLAFSFLEKYASTTINLVSTLVIARLLSPAEIGVFSVGAAVVGMMHALRDFGVTNYLIQEREIDREKVRTAFTVTLGLSWLFALVLLAISDWAAVFYGEEGIRQIIWVMAANFVLIPFGSPILALMRRELQFGRLAAIYIASTVVNAGVSILLAALGHGFMSLAWASLAGVVVTSGLAFWNRPHAFLLRPGLHEWRSIVAFGSYASGTTLIADLRATSPDLILGRMLSFEAVGLYSRAIGLLSIFNRIFLEGLQPVLLPALSEKVRRGDDLAEAYLRALGYLAVFYWPFLLFVAAMAEPVIHVMLGDQWLEAAPIIRILAIAWGIGLLGHASYPVMIALGRVREQFLVNLTTLPLAVGAMIFGAFHSLEMVALLTIGVMIVSVTVTVRVLRPYISVSLLDTMKSLRKSVIVTVLAAPAPIAAAVWRDQLIPGAPIASLALAGLGMALLWLAAVIVTQHPIAEELRFTLGKLRHAVSPGS